MRKNGLKVVYRVESRVYSMFTKQLSLKIVEVGQKLLVMVSDAFAHLLNIFVNRKRDLWGTEIARRGTSWSSMSCRAMFRNLFKLQQPIDVLRKTKIRSLTTVKLNVRAFIYKSLHCGSNI